MTSHQSKAKQQFDKAYNAKPEQKKKRAERNAARREFEDKNGDLSSTTDVAHKKALDNGGTNAPDNLKAQDEKGNRGWRKGRTGSKTYTVPNVK